MLITIDHLLNLTPVIIGNKKYWKHAGKFYEARITELGLVELKEVEPQSLQKSA